MIDLVEIRNNLKKEIQTGGLDRYRKPNGDYDVPVFWIGDVFDAVADFDLPIQLSDERDNIFESEEVRDKIYEELHTLNRTDELPGEFHLNGVGSKKSPWVVMLDFGSEDFDSIAESVRYPTVSRMVSADIGGTLFTGAEVSLQKAPDDEGVDAFLPSTAKVILPEVPKVEADQAASDFTMTLIRTVPSERAIDNEYRFTFEIKNLHFDAQPNGLMKPLYDQTLKEFTDEISVPNT